MPGKTKEFVQPTTDERELLLRWLAFLRGAVLRDIAGLSDDQARWTPPGTLIPLIGIVNHLTHVEWRWIDGSMRGEETSRSEEEFRPAEDLTVNVAVTAYHERARATEAAVRAMPSLTEPARHGDGRDLRWVLLHLINETARHAGHADAVRELLDGTTGE
ncbi:MAG: DinB family protein [Streptosporangiaceae bacterium]